LEESDFSAANHQEFLEFVLKDVFQKDFSNVVCLVGDNCATNQALASLCRKPFVGCAAHRFNLAVQKYLKDFDSIMNKVKFLLIHIHHFPLILPYQHLD
jgi:hypothetical protein